MSNFEYVKFSQRAFIGVRKTVPAKEIGKFFGETLPRVAKHLADAGLSLEEIKSAPAGRYYSFKPEAVDLVGGFVLTNAQAKKVKEAGDIKKDTLNGGSYLKCVHTGAYDKLEGAWKAAFAEIAKSGKGNDAEAGNCYELYVKDPMTTKAEELVTEIYIRVVADGKRKREDAGSSSSKVADNTNSKPQQQPKYSVHDVCHLDLAFLDKARCQKFYHDLFEWSFSDHLDEYFLFMTPGRAVNGGFSKRKDRSEVVKGSIMPYLLVKELSDSFKKQVVALGGKLLGEVVSLKTKEGVEFGCFQVVEDSEGNVIAAWKDAKAL